MLFVGPPPFLFFFPFSPFDFFVTRSLKGAPFLVRHLRSEICALSADKEETATRPHYAAISREREGGRHRSSLPLTSSLTAARCQNKQRERQKLKKKCAEKVKLLRFKTNTQILKRRKNAQTSLKRKQLVNKARLLRAPASLVALCAVYLITFPGLA